MGLDAKTLEAMEKRLHFSKPWWEKSLKGFQQRNKDIIEFTK